MPKTLIEFGSVTSGRVVAEVARLAREIWNEHYPAIIGQDQVDYMIAKFQSDNAIEEQIAAGYEYYLIVHDDMAVGYLAVVSEAGSSTLLLSKIYVRKQSRGLGIGKATLRFAESICRKRGLRAIRLSVNKHNVRAIRWYEHMGFVNFRPAVSDIGGGFIMDDFLMEKSVGRRTERGEEEKVSDEPSQ
jgi:ribosomal protein S18 acetylase RimI-like enzyme